MVSAIQIGGGREGGEANGGGIDWGIDNGWRGEGGRKNKMENVVLTFESRIATTTTRTSFRGRGRESGLNICCKQLVATGHRARPSKTASLSAESGSIMTHEISIF